MTKVALGFYGGMLAVGMCLIVWRRNADWAFDPLAPPGEGWAAGLAAAAGFAAGIHWLSRLGLRHWAVWREAAADVRAWFGGLSTGQLWALALASGIAEEVLFRGWLLNETGLVASSVIFGIVHLPPSRRWLLWPFFASAAGFALGALCLASGTLVFAVLAHALINGLNLRLLAVEERPCGLRESDQH